MANETDFNHDQLAHLLHDQLLEVPRFQRAYSWQREHVDAYLSDLARARERKDAYFMGTVVFARPSATGGRLQIVDGQQRLATTAVFLIAIHDVLQVFEKRDQADNLKKDYLFGYVLSEEAEVERLILSPADVPAYNALLEGRQTLRLLASERSRKWPCMTGCPCLLFEPLIGQLRSLLHPRRLL